MPIIIQFWINSVLIHRECIFYSKLVFRFVLDNAHKVCKVNLFIYASAHNLIMAVPRGGN